MRSGILTRSRARKYSNRPVNRQTVHVGTGTHLSGKRVNQAFDFPRVRHYISIVLEI